jgi:hypothetical protein
VRTELGSKIDNLRQSDQWNEEVGQTTTANRQNAPTLSLLNLPIHGPVGKSQQAAPNR